MAVSGQLCSGSLVYQATWFVTARDARDRKKDAGSNLDFIWFYRISMDFQLLKCLGKPDAGNGNDSESQGAEREKRLDELFTEQLGKKSGGNSVVIFVSYFLLIHMFLLYVIRI